jgi:isocitrate lyase
VQVLVSVQEHIDRLVAARLQADVMGAETILVARTDAEAASLLGEGTREGGHVMCACGAGGADDYMCLPPDNNIDARDHPFILGATTPGTR